MAERTDSPTSAKVRDLIFAFERQVSSTEPLEVYHGRPRAKSYGNALSYKMFRQPNLEFNSIMDIEKELVKIEAHLNYYEVYEKETHVAFQEQLFDVLTSIVKIDHEHALDIKKRLILETQKLATELNTRLPYDRTHSYKATRNYNSSTRKEEAVVSTSSLRSQEHTVVLSSHHSNLNERFKSEESLASTKESLDASFKLDDSSSVDFNNLEELPNSGTPQPQTKIVEDGSVPSVSRLKKFFSFRRETKPEVRVTSASYSGLSRSQSLNTKTNKYTVIKKNNIEGSSSSTKAAFNEYDEDNNIELHFKIDSSSASQNLGQINDVSNIVDSSEIGTNVEISKEFEISGQNEEVAHNISVTKLKSLFEEKRKETDEGLGLLTKKQFNSEFNIPYTAMNLGGYRLKRTISGGYMNFTGLLRNVDVKKNEIIKSKSLSDLKHNNFGYEIKDIHIDGDFSGGIDENEYEQVSVQVRTSNEVNNNLLIKESSSTQRNDDIKHILHRTIGPIPNASKEFNEHELKVPIQLTAGYSRVSHSENKNENTSQERTTEELDDGSTHIVRRRTETTNTSKEAPKDLKVSSQLNVDHVIGKSFENSSEQNIISEENEPVGEVSLSSIGSVGVLKQTFEQSGSTSSTYRSGENSTHFVNRVTERKSIIEEPHTKAFVQVTYEGHDQKYSEIASDKIDSSNEDLKQVLHKTHSKEHSYEPQLTEPLEIETGLYKSHSYQESKKSLERSAEIVQKSLESASLTGNLAEKSQLNVPVTLRVGYSNESISQSGTVKASGKSTQDIHERSTKTIHKTVDSTSVSENISNGPELNLPITLRTGYSSENSTGNISEKTISEKNEQEEVSLSTIGSVEILKQTFEQSRSASSEASTHLVGRIAEHKPFNEEPHLKDFVLARAGSTHLHEYTVEDNTGIETVVQNIGKPTAGTVEILKQTFEVADSSDKISRSNGDVDQVLHKTIETSLKNGSAEILHKSIESTSLTKHLSKQNELNVPVTFRVGYSNESISRSGTVSVSGTQEVHDRSSNIIHKTVESASVSKDTLDEPKLAERSTEDTSEQQIISKKNDLDEKISLSTIGSVEILKQTFETASTGRKIENVVELNSNPHLTSEIRNISEKHVLKVPIQLRAEFEECSEEHDDKHEVKKENITENSTHEEISTGIVETLIQSFEHSNSTISTDQSDTDIKVLNSSVDSVTSNAFSEEHVLKVPVQSRIGVSNVSQQQQVTEQVFQHGETDQSNMESLTLAASVQSLKQTFEKTNSSEVSDVDHQNILHKTMDTVTKTTVSKVPVQMPSGFGNSNDSDIGIREESREQKTYVSSEKKNESLLQKSLSKVIHFTGRKTASTETGAVSEQSELSIEHQNVNRIPSVDVTIHSNGSVERVLAEEKNDEEQLSKVSVQEKTQNFLKLLQSPTHISSKISETSVVSSHSGLSIEDQNVYRVGTADISVNSNGSGDSVIIEEENDEEALSKASIQEKTQNFLKILQSPTHLSSKISSSSFGQLTQLNSSESANSSSTSSKLSMSYSEQKSVQHSSTTRVTQRIVSSSSSSLSSQTSQSQNSTNILDATVSQPLLSRMNPEITDEENQVTITELEDNEETRHPNVDLSVSQENLVDEMLGEADSFENVDEEFEKMLEKYHMSSNK